MSNSLALVENSVELAAASSVTLSQDEKNAVAAAILSAKSANTRRAYDKQLKPWRAYCDAHNCKPFVDDAVEVAAVVAAYVTALAEQNKSASYISQAVAAIKDSFVMKGFKGAAIPTDDPAVKLAVISARHRVGTAVTKKAALTPEILKSMVATCSASTLRGLRDRAVLLLGFAGAFRRSELAALTWQDIEQTFDAAGRRAYLVTVRRSKTDQNGAGMIKGIFSARAASLDPVEALEKYRDALAAAYEVTPQTPVFPSLAHNSNGAPLSGFSVATIVQTAARRAGVDLDVAAHSLRAGFVTTALTAGKSERSVMNQTGHKSVTVMRGYQRRVNALQDNAAAGLL